MSEERIRNIIRTLDNMPPLIPAVGKVFEIANDPHSTVEDMDKVISMDMVISAKLLKLVNSAYYGLQDKITTTNRAIIHLGMNTIKNLVMTVAVMKNLSENFAGTSISLEDYWQHSLACSVACRILAKKSGMGAHTVDDITLSGLLHDIGKMALMKASISEYQKVVRLAAEKNVSSIAAERQVLVPDHRIAIESDSEVESPLVGTKIVHIDHCYIGKELASRWRFPDVLQEPIFHHHMPWECPEPTRKACYILYVADAFCKMNGMGFAGDKFVPKWHQDTWAVIGIDEGVLSRMTEQWNKEVAESKDFMDL